MAYWTCGTGGGGGGGVGGGGGGGGGVGAGGVSLWGITGFVVVGGGGGGEWKCFINLLMCGFYMHTK